MASRSHKSQGEQQQDNKRALEMLNQLLNWQEAIIDPHRPRGHQDRGYPMLSIDLRNGVHQGVPTYEKLDLNPYIIGLQNLYVKLYQYMHSNKIDVDVGYNVKSLCLNNISKRIDFFGGQQAYLYKAAEGAAGVPFGYVSKTFVQPIQEHQQAEQSMGAVEQKFDAIMQRFQQAVRTLHHSTNVTDTNQ